MWSEKDSHLHQVDTEGPDQIKRKDCFESFWLYHRHSELISKYNAGLKTFLQGLSARILWRHDLS